MNIPQESIIPKDFKIKSEWEVSQHSQSFINLGQTVGDEDQHPCGLKIQAKKESTLMKVKT